jgi:hypothetical protein
MRHAILLVLALVTGACTSAEEKARQREAAMIGQAIADSVAELEFMEDSTALAASITVDTVASMRTIDAPVVDGDAPRMPLHQAVSPRGQVCTITVEKSIKLAPGDTLSCQWASAP